MVSLLLVGLVLVSFMFFLEKKQVHAKARPKAKASSDFDQGLQEPNTRPIQTLRQNDIYIPDIVEKSKK